ncbi:MAG: segregation/condensation protein A [Anaerolineae bacterium]|nr:segregation/condensation protein A [Anaerolineae bacterium]
MSFQIAAHQTEGYLVNTPIYEGPLDLLLKLIEHAELDITQLALAQVTDQYLDYSQKLPSQDPAEVSAFLVIAARLLQIKSNALLPRPSILPQTQEEDPGDALVKQLLQYKRFKELAVNLEEKESSGSRTFLRVVPPSLPFEPRLDLSDLTLDDILQTARQIFLKANPPQLTNVLSRPRITIREKIHAIISALKHASTTSFKSVLISQNRTEVVITFLAMLELIKRHIIEAHQEVLFDDILMHPLENLDENQELELEFGE